MDFPREIIVLFSIDYLPLVDYCFHRSIGFCCLKSKVYFFTLNLNLDEVLKDRGNRKLDDWERERIKHHYQIGINKPSFGKIIETTNQTPKETLESIISWLK